MSEFMNDISHGGRTKVTLGEIARNLSENEYKPKEKGLDRCVGLEHLDPGSLKVRRWLPITPEMSFTRRFSQGQILFGKRRAYQKKVALADFDGICSSDILVIEAKKENFVPELLPFIIQDDRFFEYAVGTSSGSLSPRTKWKFLADYKIWLPPLEEQHRIATTLWAMEQCLERNELFLKAAERLKQVSINSLLSRGIRHKEFKNFKDIGSIPKDWNIKTLIEIVGNKNDLIVGGPFGSSLKVCDYKDKGVPIIRLQNVDYGRFLNKDIKYISEEKADELKYHSFLSGDLVLAKLGDPIGKTCKIPQDIRNGIVVADVVRIRLKNPEINLDYLLYVLNSSFVAIQLNRGTIGTTRPRVNVGDIRKLFIPLPKYDEQLHIATILSRCDETIAAAHANVAAIKALKMKMIKEMLSPDMI